MAAYSVDYSRFDDIVDSDDEQTPASKAASLPEGVGVPSEAMPPEVQRAAALMRQAQLSGDPGAIQEAHKLVQDAMKRNPSVRSAVEQHARGRMPPGLGSSTGSSTGTGTGTGATSSSSTGSSSTGASADDVRSRLKQRLDSLNAGQKSLEAQMETLKQLEKAGPEAGQLGLARFLAEQGVQEDELDAILQGNQDAMRKVAERQFGADGTGGSTDDAATETAALERDVELAVEMGDRMQQLKDSELKLEQLSKLKERLTRGEKLGSAEIAALRTQLGLEGGSGGSGASPNHTGTGKGKGKGKSKGTSKGRGRQSEQSKAQALRRRLAELHRQKQDAAEQAEAADAEAARAQRELAEVEEQKERQARVVEQARAAVTQEVTPGAAPAPSAASGAVSVPDPVPEPALTPAPAPAVVSSPVGATGHAAPEYELVFATGTLTVQISLPHASSMKGIELSVSATAMEMDATESCGRPCKLSIKLPLRVSQGAVRAKFSKRSKLLKLTMPLLEGQEQAPCSMDGSAP